MNHIQIELEKFRRAAHLARFEPVGKPFKQACDMIERLERVLRSISKLAPRLETEEISTLTEAALNGVEGKVETDEVEADGGTEGVARKRRRKVPGAARGDASKPAGEL